MCAVDVLRASKYLRRDNIITFILSHDVVVFVELCYQRSAKSSADNPSRDGCVQSWHFGRVLRTGRHRCEFIPSSKRFVVRGTSKKSTRKQWQPQQRRAEQRSTGQAEPAAGTPWLLLLKAGALGRLALGQMLES